MTNEQLQQVIDELIKKRRLATMRADACAERGEESGEEYYLGLATAYGIAMTMIQIK